MSSLTEVSEADLNRIINSIPIFSGVGMHEQHLIADKCVIAEAKADEIIIKQGDIGDHLYIIIKGKVLISKQTKSKKCVKINTLGPGDVFGEIAILRNIRRTAFVTTLEPCTFLTIDAHDFLKIYQYFSAASRDNIQLVIEKRLLQQNIE